VNKKFFLFLEEILIVSIFQYIFYNFLNFKIVPSFFLIYLLLLSFEGSQEVSIFLSFFLGIINDFFSKGILGTSSIRYLLIVYFSSFFVVKSIKEKSIFIFIFSFLYFVLSNLEKRGELIWSGKILLKYTILFSIYNFLIAVIIEIFMREIKRKWKEKYF
jgi:rod shape-determining protein MreD